MAILPWFSTNDDCILDQVPFCDLRLPEPVHHQSVLQLSQLWSIFVSFLIDFECITFNCIPKITMPHQCDWESCGASMRDAAALFRHCYSTHWPFFVREFVCEPCEKGYLNVASFQSHLQATRHKHCVERTETEDKDIPSAKQQARTWILENRDNNKLSDKLFLHLTSYEQTTEEDMEDKILVPQYTPMPKQNLSTNNAPLSPTPSTSAADVDHGVEMPVPLQTENSVFNNPTTVMLKHKLDADASTSNDLPNDFPDFPASLNDAEEMALAQLKRSTSPPRKRKCPEPTEVQEQLKHLQDSVDNLRYAVAAQDVKLEQLELTIKKKVKEISYEQSRHLVATLKSMAEDNQTFLRGLVLDLRHDMVSFMKK